VSENEQQKTTEPSSKGNGEAVLSMRDVDTYYGAIQALRGVSIEIHPGEIVCLLGSNAAGKTTTLKTILGLTPPREGTVHLFGERIDGKKTTQIVSRGITMVPEARRLFTRMTVKENLEVGAQLRNDREGIDRDFKRVLEIFPRLEERLSQKAGTLSGGEQQMLAMGRALMAHPKVLLMDEPSMGLAPILVEQVFDTIKEINARGVTILLVEQNAHMALEVANRAYVLQTGSVVLADSAQRLRDDPKMQEAYLGEVT
jgi:branched-chain amino acid transport system ATP-binding protein